MRTTLDIPEDLLASAKQLLKTRTKSEAVTKALCEAVRRRQIENLLALRGKIDIEDVSEDLEQAELDHARRTR